MTDIALIVLAAGQGTRMKSALPKVMHRVAGRTLLGHVLTSATGLSPKRAVVVVGPDMDAVGLEAQRYFPGCNVAIQQERQGTAHAVSMAKEGLKGFSGTILVLYADVPLVQGSSLSALAGQLDKKTQVAVLGFEAADPRGYGRLLKARNGSIRAIREELDATAQERKIKLCNSGILSVNSSVLWKLIPQIENKNAKREYYLTDLVERAAKAGLQVGLATCPEAEVAGVNDRVQLGVIEAKLQAQYRRDVMLGGATLMAPDTVYFSADTKIGMDVVIEPNVFFGPGVIIGNNVHILANSHLEGASISSGARIGPFARLRPGAEIGENAHIGNFVEVKKSVIAKGVKANHLAYIGDARVGLAPTLGQARLPATMMVSRSISRILGPRSLWDQTRPWWPRSRSAMAQILQREALLPGMCPPIPLPLPVLIFRSKMAGRRATGK